MRAAPSVTQYNPSAANNSWRISSGTDQAMTAENISDSRVSFEAINLNEGGTQNVWLMYGHADATAEL
jgi:hypothetical protein